MGMLKENMFFQKKESIPAMPISSRRYLLPFEELAKYLGFAESVAD